HLANRRFPAGNFMRPPKQMDYLEEPDVFHDVFGHVPLLAQPAVADFMVELGNLGLKALEIGEIERVARLYWYTIEFGLAREGGRTKIYGAGIASSFGETHYSLESPRPHRLKFGLELIGSSIARGVRKAMPGVALRGYDSNPDIRSRAARLKLVDVLVDEPANVAGADLVIFCVPVGAMGDAGRAVAPGVAPGAVV